ncbi:VCBS repeat-containing protein, partial [Myxococcota bacterium]|nr:VCBS repeat-containing protein [Myxococcota bacterium]
AIQTFKGKGGGVFESWDYITMAGHEEPEPLGEIWAVDTGDVDGDGDQDICARSNAGIWCWTFDGTGFVGGVTGPFWDDASGWNDFRLYTSINLGDVNGDGMADICGRNSTEVKCYLSDGAGFPTEVTGPTMRDADGWSAYRYFSTIRFGGVRPLPTVCEPTDTQDITCDGVDDDCDGLMDEDAQSSCDDGNLCNGTETCSMELGQCAPGSPLECGESGCVPSLGCCPQGTTAQGENCVGESCDPDNDTCDDGDRCNGAELCDGELGHCVMGQPPECGEGGCVPSVGCCPPGTSAQGDACVETDPGTTNASGGCSCTAAGRTSGPTALLLLFLMAGVIIGRFR